MKAIVMSVVCVVLTAGSVSAQVAPSCPVTELKVGEPYHLENPGRTYAKVIQVLDDGNMLVGIDNGPALPGGEPRYSVVVWVKAPTKGITDGKKCDLSDLIGYDRIKVTGTKKYKLASGGTRTVFVVEAYK